MKSSSFESLPQHLLFSEIFPHTQINYKSLQKYENFEKEWNENTVFLSFRSKSSRVLTMKNKYNNKSNIAISFFPKHGNNLKMTRITPKSNVTGYDSAGFEYTMNDIKIKFYIPSVRTQIDYEIEFLNGKVFANTSAKTKQINSTLAYGISYLFFILKSILENTSSYEDKLKAITLQSSNLIGFVKEFVKEFLQNFESHYVTFFKVNSSGDTSNSNKVFHSMLNVLTNKKSVLPSINKDLQRYHDDLRKLGRRNEINKFIIHSKNK